MTPEARAQCGVGLPEITDLASHALIEGRSHDLRERLPIDAEGMSVPTRSKITGEGTAPNLRGFTSLGDDVTTSWERRRGPQPSKENL